MPDGRHRPLPSPRATALAADAAVAGGLLAAAVLDPPASGEWARWQWIVAAALTAAVLMLRRRHPVGALAGVVALWLGVHTDRASDDPPFQFIALLIAVYAVGAHAPTRRGAAGLLLACVAFSAMNLARGEAAEAAIAGSVQFSALFAFGVLLGRATRRERALEDRARRLEAERDERARAAVADERARIARDLHDALGHTISAIVLQVGVVRRRLRDDQGTEREVLLGVERSGRDAVGEMRRMLGMLRGGDGDATLAPVPGLDRIGELAETSRAAGVPVEVAVSGERRAVPAGIDVAGYRIVQEALTNVLRHAGGASASVRVAYEPGSVTVEVSDDGSGAAANGAGGAGHGLIGMRERVTLYGGELDAGPRPDGGFTVRARLPFGRAAG